MRKQIFGQGRGIQLAVFYSLGETVKTANREEQRGALEVIRVNVSISERRERPREEEGICSRWQGLGRGNTTVLRSPDVQPLAFFLTSSFEGQMAKMPASLCWPMEPGF